MIRVLHRDGMVLELAAAGARMDRAPLHFPDAVSARRLLPGNMDPRTVRVARDLLAATGEPAVARWTDSAVMDRLALALATGRVRASIARQRHTTDNVGHPPLPDIVEAVVAAVTGPGVTSAISAVAAREAMAAVARPWAPPPPLPPVDPVAAMPLPAMTAEQQALYNGLSPAAKAFFDQAVQIATTSDVRSPQAVFWSGSGADVMAREYAAQNGFLSLEATPGGKALDDLYQGAKMWARNDSDRTDAINEIRKANLTMVPWGLISARYGANGHGEVMAFVTGQTRPNSVFYRIELPRALARNVSVVPVSGTVTSFPDGTRRVDITQQHTALTATNTRVPYLNAEQQRAVDFYQRYPAHPNLEQARDYSAVTRHYDGTYNVSPLTATDRTRVTAITGATTPP